MNTRISDKVLEDLGEEFLPSRPSNSVPKLPRDITELDDEGLMDLFVQLTQWNAYTSGMYAVAVINEREAETNLEFAEDIALFDGWKNKSSTKGILASVLKAEIAVLPNIVELREDLNVRYAYRKMIEARDTSVERDTQLVSRELTRRTSDSGSMRTRTRRFVS